MGAFCSPGDGLRARVGSMAICSAGLGLGSSAGAGGAHFPEISRPSERCSPEATFQAGCLPSISLFSLLDPFPCTLACPASQLERTTALSFLRCAFRHARLSLSIGLFISPDIQLCLGAGLKQSCIPLSSLDSLSRDFKFLHTRRFARLL